MLSPYLFLCSFNPFYLFSFGLFHFNSSFPLCLSICPTRSTFHPFPPGLGYRKVSIMDDIKVLPCSLTSGWFYSLEGTSRTMNSGKNMKLGYLFSLSPICQVAQLLSCMQSTAFVGVTGPFSQDYMEISGWDNEQMLKLWLLLLL